MIVHFVRGASRGFFTRSWAINSWCCQDVKDTTRLRFTPCRRTRVSCVLQAWCLGINYRWKLFQKRLSSFLALAFFYHIYRLKTTGVIITVCCGRRHSMDSRGTGGEVMNCSGPNSSYITRFFGSHWRTLVVPLVFIPTILVQHLPGARLGTDQVVLGHGYGSLVPNCKTGPDYRLMLPRCVPVGILLQHRAVVASGRRACCDAYILMARISTVGSPRTSPDGDDNRYTCEPDKSATTSAPSWARTYHYHGPPGACRSDECLRNDGGTHMYPPLASTLESTMWDRATCATETPKGKQCLARICPRARH
ncbi:hypothetical protein BDN71DRAFT_753875 [Pleurotus eryngii]|uniref:Uncharacterized protein n=1 Tax=Pleurotus eryngii TaxID=5323 RepID=A0A9P5ZYS3_PLEER|nr:hypothetical protein BDN71DRAFT_753875 [Pleurotus eryngii]